MLYKKNYSYNNNKINMINEYSNLNLKKIGILIFTFYFSTLNTLISQSTVVTTIILITSILLLLFSNFYHKNVVILSKVDIMWVLFFIMFFLNIIIRDINNTNVVDIIVYFSCVLFLILVKANIVQFLSSFKLIKILSITYALSAIIQYYWTDLYLDVFLPLFNINEQRAILHLLASNSYAGFTNQTAHLAGFIVNGIGLIIFSYHIKNRLSNKVASIIFLLILIIGLLLAGKRAHLIFMVISLIITYISSAKSKERFLRVLKIFIFTIIVIFFAVSLVMIFGIKTDTPFGLFFNEISETIIGFLMGNDVTNGRSILYKYSLEIFSQHPIFGIGWRGFSQNSIGLISREISHPHNIYLQILSEFGVVGFLLFISPLIYSYYKTYKKLSIVSTNHIGSETNQLWKVGLKFSLYSQSFFILYGMTGNLLTDYNFLLVYFLACAISTSAAVKIKTY